MCLVNQADCGGRRYQLSIRVAYDLLWLPVIGGACNSGLAQAETCFKPAAVSAGLYALALGHLRRGSLLSHKVGSAGRLWRALCVAAEAAAEHKQIWRLRDLPGLP
jgi:hypothetical protein